MNSFPGVNERLALQQQTDHQKVNACLLIYQIIKESGRDENNALNCVIHLQQQEFLNTMRSHNLVKDSHDGLMLNIFNIYENSARELFENNPPDCSGIGIDSKEHLHIIIIGFGKAGEALAIQTTLTGHYINGGKAVGIDHRPPGVGEGP